MPRKRYNVYYHVTISIIFQIFFIVMTLIFLWHINIDCCLKNVQWQLFHAYLGRKPLGLTAWYLCFNWLPEYGFLNVQWQLYHADLGRKPLGLTAWYLCFIIVQWQLLHAYYDGKQLSFTAQLLLRKCQMAQIPCLFRKKTNQLSVNSFVASSLRFSVKYFMNIQEDNKSSFTNWFFLNSDFCLVKTIAYKKDVVWLSHLSKRDQMTQKLTAIGHLIYIYFWRRRKSVWLIATSLTVPW